jgi:hypothetical protein
MLICLPSLPGIVNAKDAVYQNAMPCDNRGEAEDLDDTTSTSGSDAPGGDLTTQREDISGFGVDGSARNIYQRHGLLCTSGGRRHATSGHCGMKNWGPMNLHLHGYIIALLGDGPNHKLPMRLPGRSPPSSRLCTTRSRCFVKSIALGHDCCAISAR